MSKTIPENYDLALEVIRRQAVYIGELESIIQAAYSHAQAVATRQWDQEPRVEQPIGIEWARVIRVEADSFFSKTTNSRRSMWRLRTDDGRQANVFDHSDPLRDSKPMLKAAGYYDAFDAMIAGQTDRWATSPIEVELVSDGQWWKVKQIKPRPDGSAPDLTDEESDGVEPTHSKPIHRMFYAQGEIDLKEELWDMNRKAGVYDDVLGPVKSEGDPDIPF